MSTYKKDKPCQSLKIWSDQGCRFNRLRNQRFLQLHSSKELTKELIDFGVSIYHQYNQDLINGEASASGCGFFNEKLGLSGFAKKTKGGLGTIFVRKENN